MWLTDFILKIQDFFHPAVEPIKPVIITPKPETYNTYAANLSAIPQCGIDLIDSFEKCELQAYMDQGGIWTLGWGHTKGVKKGDICTQIQADTWRQEDLAWVAAVIAKDITAPLTSNQRGALGSFIYNLGQTRFEKEARNLIAIINSGNYAGASTKIKQFVWYSRPDGGRALSQGLANRRKAEATLWTGGDWRQS